MKKVNHANGAELELSGPSFTQEDLDDFAFLSRANEQGYIGVAITHIEPQQQQALERAISNSWVQLVDVTILDINPNVLSRVFRLTQEGASRLINLGEL